MKTYSKILKSWKWKLYPNSPVITGEQNISIREIKNGYGDEYVISYKMLGFRDLKEILAESEGKEIRVSFVRRFGKRFVNNIATGSLVGDGEI
jgi:hypothetical protein